MRTVALHFLFKPPLLLDMSPSNIVYLQLKVRRKSLETASIEGKQRFSLLRLNGSGIEPEKRPLLLKGHLVDNCATSYKKVGVN